MASIRVLAPRVPQLAWTLRGIDVLAEELTDWLDCGTCTHINNLAGLVSWACGFALWLTSIPRVRRSRYSLFFASHQVSAKHVPELWP